MDARQLYHEVLRQQLDYVLASPAPCNAEQQTIIDHIRQARAFYCNHQRSRSGWKGTRAR
eukprot:2854621-Pyramimonas_sp.AAC.1